MILKSSYLYTVTWVPIPSLLIIGEGGTTNGESENANDDVRLTDAIGFMSAGTFFFACGVTK